MEHDDRHLDSLTESTIEYFNEVLIHKNCVSSTFRKYSVKNDEDVEFSFLLLSSTFNETKPFYKIESSTLTEEEAKKIIKVSECWRLRIEDVSIEGSKLCLRLNRPHAFRTVVRSVLNRKSDYGKCFSKKQIMRVTSDECGISDLTGYRLNLLKSSAENLLRAGGYELRSGKEGRWVHFTTRNSAEGSEGGAKLKVLCGPVVNSRTKVKETQITPQEYRELRTRDLEGMSESKISNSEILDRLVEASVILSLLQVKCGQSVSLNLSPTHSGPRETASKGGAFLQYNSARLAAIREKHGERVAEGSYPDPPRPEEVDFAVLKEPEEWALLFNFLLEYPTLIRRLSEEMANGKSNIHQLCDFLSKLCSLFSVYYRRVRILLEPRDHLLPTIHARLLLARSVEQVLENGLAILNINKVEQM